MSKKDAIWLGVTCVIAGLVAGFTVGVVCMVPRTFIDRGTVERCKEMRDYINGLPEEDFDRFWRETNSSEALKETWKIRMAIADIPLAAEPSRKMAEKAQ